MNRAFCLGIVACLAITGVTRGGEDSTQTAAGGAGGAAPPPDAKPAEESKVLAAVREALERNTQEIRAIKEQYARDMEEQRKKVESQQQQIETLGQMTKLLQEQLAQARGEDRQKQLSQAQQEEIDLLEKQSRLVADQLEKQAPVVENLQTQAATLASRAKQAAVRDKALADAHDALVDAVDNQRRNPPWLPAPLKELFLPSGTNVTPISIFNTISTRYDLFRNHKGAGAFQFEEYTPFFLVQLNKRMLLSAETSFNQGGVSLGQAQLDIFLNNWLTADIGYFLAPVGFWSERLDPRWINKLPDIPLVMQQVIPDGLTLTGLQFRGAKYLFRSPFKLEYSAYMTNGLGVPGAGKAADWYDLGSLIGTTANVNNAMAYGARLAIWIPTLGINFGASEFVNAPYGKENGAVVSLWQPYVNYHRGNWDARFEYGQNYEATRSFIGTNINRTGLYAQLAYRDYQSLHKHLQRLEYVLRFSDAMFHGIDQKTIQSDAFSPPTSAPVDRNQYTLGINYYLYASSIMKFAYEFNNEVRRSFNDNVFMMQFATNF
jgi:hypothetical protein